MARMKAISTAASVLALAGCVAPFSDFQSARTVAPGAYELTPSYSYVLASFDGETEKTQDEFGVQFAAGLSDRAEIRARYFFISIEGESTNAFGVGPKLSLAPGRLAAYVPVGVAFGGGIESGDTWQTQPTLLFTPMTSTSAEITLSAKAQIWLNNDSDNLVAFNVGGGFGPDISRWAIRPEIGLLINPGEDGSFWHFGVGVSTSLGGQDP